MTLDEALKMVKATNFRERFLGDPSPDGILIAAALLVAASNISAQLSASLDRIDTTIDARMLAAS